MEHCSALFWCGVKFVLNGSALFWCGVPRGTVQKVGIFARLQCFGAVLHCFGAVLHCFGACEREREWY